jgi:ribosomal protein S14
MATMYAQPAAANYYAPAAQAHYGHKSRGYRLCDQCGSVENPAIAKFRLCGGCMTTQYCVCSISRHNSILVPITTLTLTCSPPTVRRHTG